MGCAGASHGGQNGPARKFRVLGFRVFSGFAGSGIGWWNVFYRGNEVKRNYLGAAPYGVASLGF